MAAQQDLVGGQRRERAAVEALSPPAPFVGADRFVATGVIGFVKREALSRRR
ncbi:hypothetical protein [Amycolatopsis sp. cmx-4-68]|uniref:hypothetical protein n=1 Tax=Amycolatopsis sp. cmx-4-68 TaxID=2790938 RepID=UPI00397B99CA